MCTSYNQVTDLQTKSQIYTYFLRIELPSYKLLKNNHRYVAWQRQTNCNSSIHFRFPKTQLDRPATNQISVTGDAALNNRRIVNRPHACSREEPLLAQRSEVGRVNIYSMCVNIYIYLYIDTHINVCQYIIYLSHLFLDKQL